MANIATRGGHGVLQRGRPFFAGLVLTGLLAAGVACLGGTACSTKGGGIGAPPPCPEQTTCMRDPVAHCVASPGQGCVDSTQCAIGLACDREAVDIDASCADSGGCFARQCGLASGAIDDQLLIAGFDTASFDIQGAASGLHVVFSWTPPPGAVAVSCALFICAPEFGPAAGATSIINFSECAIAQTT
ncbi:MAG TPA: hypothetical protein VIF09_18585, partial [Polyangiaceae bacterium]